MLTIKDFLDKSNGRVHIYNDFKINVEKDITDKLIVCIPDMHLLDRGRKDDFLRPEPSNEKRFIEMLQFLLSLQKEEEIEVVQLGDMYELVQANGNIELIETAYEEVVKTFGKLSPTYIVGNHDYDLAKPTWDEDKSRNSSRVWRHIVAGPDRRLRVLFEHGFQADYFNRGAVWSKLSLGETGKHITKIVGMMEYIKPDIDVHLGSTWEGISGVIKKLNVFSPVQDPQGFDPHELLSYYINLLDKFNHGDTWDTFQPADVDFCLAVIGHTHDARLVAKPKNGRTYYLMDCGAWVNGKHEIGIISGKEMAVCQWE